MSDDAASIFNAVCGFFSKVMAGPSSGDVVSYIRGDDVVQQGQVLDVTTDGVYRILLIDTGKEVQVPYSRLLAKLQPVVAFEVEEVYNQKQEDTANGGVD